MTQIICLGDVWHLESTLQDQSLFNTILLTPYKKLPNTSSREFLETGSHLASIRYVSLTFILVD